MTQAARIFATPSNILGVRCCIKPKQFRPIDEATSNGGSLTMCAVFSTKVEVSNEEGSRVFQVGADAQRFARCERGITQFSWALRCCMSSIVTGTER